MQSLSAHPDHAILWREDRLYLLDQRQLPARETFLPLETAAETARAIRDMVVRGAPAIGIAAAYGVVLAARARYEASKARWKQEIAADLEQFAAARPTAVNLFWALRRMNRRIADLAAGDPVPHLLAEAQAIHREDREANRRMGELGAALIQSPSAVLTHCNAGALATGGYGTALGVIRSAFAQGKIPRVYVDETRPWLQGSRLTAWELQRSGIPVVLQAEGAAASLLAQGAVGWVIVGADRIAANGDVANKIGTYGLALLARHHGVRFMVVAPTSTLDGALARGADIPIETRDPEELLRCGGQRLAPAGVAARNPVFDVTPAEYIDALVTEQGVLTPPSPAGVESLLKRAEGAAKSPQGSA